MWRKTFINVLMISNLAAFAICIAGTLLFPAHRGEPSFAYRFGTLIGFIWLTSLLWSPIVLYQNNKRKMEKVKTVEIEVIE